ncbi:MAG: helix-turn-helix domain-containing protein [Candidatus Bathyarchaeia archaeon]
MKPHQIQKILKLREEGFTFEDIAKKVGVSLSSVKKYLKQNRQQLKVESAFNPSQPLEKVDKSLEQVVMENRAMIRKILELLCSDAGLLNNPLEAHIYGENEEECINLLAEAQLEMWRHIFNINAELGKKLILKQKPYEPYLEPINEKEKEYLVKWIGFAKEHCPELLAEFVKVTLE